jgi:hypothetical protein
MRFVLAFLLCLGSFTAKAATYYIDLNTVTPDGIFPGSCYCGNGLIFPFMPFAPGDVVDFGSVTIPAQQVGHIFSGPPVYLQAGAGAVYEPGSFPGWYWPYTTAGSSATFDLIYTIPVGKSGIRVGWNGPGFYTPPPELATAVPETTTWAMMIFGFAGIALLAFRRKTLSASFQRQSFAAS